MGLRKVMGFRHNWNGSVIHQFYATLEVDMEDECLTWMTGKKSFVASFQDFASLIGLDYEEMKTGKSIGDLPPMQQHETYVFYPDKKHNHGASKDLRTYPSLIFSMLRHTIMPKVGNSDVVRVPYYEAIRAILSRDKLNIVEWMGTRMVECKLDMRGAMVF